ncbi:fatty acid elongation protein-like protein [Suhomyces tanzawaensis NRRL Y-17324]|uniref:Elongation of fatty acids protein n=1 Tax=Suhomyces tanzawaensis NRRL Y-17324 TaxID=984487 RepID=A0A1E4SND5_9ASCO|nr:fatty acid elongation protein-like protein [Suhomyces tanzawaensis NRRL Y-17324]ODV81039.1 fatty acid elongation protein-like protein [Suhomyces tanzawaensis NRRL Y-17324]
MALIHFGLPSPEVWKFPNLNTPVAPSPFLCQLLTQLYEASMKVTTPMTIAIVYFTSVHFINPIVRKRQLNKYYAKAGAKGDSKAANPKKLPAAPYSISQTAWFRVFVLVHNIFLCAYSAWTFLGMTSSIVSNMEFFKGSILPSFFQDQEFTYRKVEVFFQLICDSKQGVFSRLLNDTGIHNLEVFGFWFYISKFYEVIDTIIILLKGRESSLLQSYHHAGAMMCMWAGIRFQSPPIWIFVVFNSFIHSLMYFYFSLSCLHIRVPNIFKRLLTTLQITQFVIGGSIAILHAFVWIIDTSTSGELELISCISNPDQALSILINVAYLTPLTMLFGAFYIDSYLKRK